jgi:Ca-activated chloride channel homolog
MIMNTTPRIEELRMGCIVVTSVPTASSLPLEHTDVVAHVSGPLASVSVAQRFGNSFSETVELAYLFPLPHGAAIVDYELRIGQRVIRAEIKELEEARRTYSAARDQGQRAGLLWRAFSARQWFTERRCLPVPCKLAGCLLALSLIRRVL